MGEVEARAGTSARVLDAVISLLDSEGYDGWSLATMARQARVSLRDVYRFPNHGDLRAELIAAALARWMEQHHVADMTVPGDRTLADGLMSCFSALLGPWTTHPRLLEAYQHARLGPAGRALDDVGLAAFRPAVRALLAGLDEAYARDLGEILASITEGLIVEVVRGEITMTDVLSRLDRALHRLTSDNAALSATRRRRTTSSAARSSSSPAG